MNDLTEANLRGFAAHWKAKGHSTGTLSEYMRHLRRYAAHHPGAITLTDVREYGNGELERSRSQGRYSVRALKAYTKYLAEEYDESDVLAKLKIPKDDTPDPNRTKIASPDDVSKILGVCAQSSDDFAKRDHAIISVLSCTGMRRAELAAMTWQYVDLVEGTVTIPKTKNKQSRTVRLTPEALRSVKRHARHLPSHILWWNVYRRPLTADAVSAIVERRAKAAEVVLTSHCFRRGMAVDWLRRGGSETYLRKIAGWSTPSMVQRYTNVVAQSEALNEHKRLYG